MAPQDPGRPEDKPEGLSKYIKRMKTVLRPRSGSKRQSVAALPDVGPSSQSAYVLILYYPNCDLQSPSLPFPPVAIPPATMDQIANHTIL